MRGKLVQRYGGTKETELAVDRGLDWLARHQAEDGRWSLDAFGLCGDCRGRCRDPGLHSDTAGTAMALMAFLGAGQTHQEGRFKKEVEGGLRWLIRDQMPTGEFHSLSGGRMYAQGQGAIALCEALALTSDNTLREPAQLAINYIVDAQHEAGGWRYQYRTPGDTSVLGWQIMGLRSAQSAELRFPAETLERATWFLDSVQSGQAGGLYGYTGPGATYPMTAEGLLCRMYTGWPHDHPGLTEGVNFLLTGLPDRNRPDMYYWYYATQVMHHYGGDPWNRWNDAIRALLVQTQETSGHETGSWPMGGGHDRRGGRVYMTALAVCTLEVYYRHLPLYAK